MGKVKAIVRRVDGCAWLVKHSRRSEIVKFVCAAGSAPVPAWVHGDAARDKILRDRAVWQAANPPKGEPVPGLREIGERCGVSYQTVKNILDAYASDLPSASFVPRLSLRVQARKVVTREVVRKFDAGQLSATQVAEIIGNGADHRNALYWVNRMRDLYAQKDARKG